MHGGQVHAAARRWGIDPEQVIDFSANINPLGVPLGVRQAIENGLRKIKVESYPDTNEFATALAASKRLMADEIVIGSGTASLMFAALHALCPTRVLLFEPAFSEYQRACLAAGCAVTSWSLTEKDTFYPEFERLVRAIKSKEFDLVILNSPHNPTGCLYAREDLLSVVDAAEENNVSIMLDEAFIDYEPEKSLLSLAPTKANLIVLRSLTKFYAMPGLRIGYAVCGAKLAATIRAQIDPWSVSTIALEAATAALNETEFTERSRDMNHLAREEFAYALRGLGLLVFPSAANFLLAKLPGGCGSQLSTWLQAHRILIRRCDSFQGLGDEYIRLAVRSREDNLGLASLIEQWLSEINSERNPG
ncbi:MAG TPA: threonine-phosphate decarboxylase CobD [Pyrinomonadaceae bacterium]|nr:threonine-phosphate decarboxylase CobD [Pyrinomonadaceae bacterium]